MALRRCLEHYYTVRFALTLNDRESKNPDMKVIAWFQMIIIGASVFIGATTKADIVFFSGYYDLSPAASGGGPPLPNLWIGSPNTTFYGSTSDQSSAVASDPDIAGLLIQNTGSVSATLSALSLSPVGMDILARATTPNGNLPAGSVTMLPGQSYIFAVGDGSEENLSGQTVQSTLNGTTFSFADAHTTLAPSGVLFGDSPNLGNQDETQPWTQIGTVPEPSGIALLGVSAIYFALRRRAK